MSEARGSQLDRKSGQTVEGPNMLAIGISDLTETSEPPDLNDRGVATALRPRSQSTYRGAWNGFERWCTETNRVCLPAEPETILDYLRLRAATSADDSLKVFLHAIKLKHEDNGFTLDENSIRKNFLNIKGRPKKDRVWISDSDVVKVIHSIPETLEGKLSKSLLLLARDGQLERGRLTDLEYKDVLRFRDDGVEIAVHGPGTERKALLIPSRTDELCPATALRAWLEESQITDGYAFRRVVKGHATGTGLTGREVTTIVKAATELGIGRALTPTNLSSRGRYITMQESAERMAEFLPIETISAEGGEAVETEEGKPYTVDNIIDDGCFLPRAHLLEILDSWQSKKNLILQGPPGTGKTWLAKRLGFALIGSKSESRLRVVQFHPSLAYEDFVRGWRPDEDGKLRLIDGPLMQAIQAAVSDPERLYVLVIEEINRGNPAQILGEMLTLIESTKRSEAEAMELAYPKKGEGRVYVPLNLFIIGTMNVADRSLAIVDFALRRRFSFIDLEPRFCPEWYKWCFDRHLDDELCKEIEARISELNEVIASAASLGPQYKIGHAVVTPYKDERIDDGYAWFRTKVKTEIGPLLDEYWYGDREQVKVAMEKLLYGLP